MKEQYGSLDGVEVSIDRVDIPLFDFLIMKLDYFSYVIVNGIVQSSTEKPRNHQSKDSNPPSKARSFDNSRNNRPTSHDNRDSGYKKINNNNNGQESRVEDRKGTGDKTNNRFTAEERPSLTHSKEREGRSVNSEAANNDRSRQGFNPTDENRNNSRTEQRSERSEKPPSRTQVSLPFLFD